MFVITVWDFKPLDNKCRNGSCLKIVWLKIQYRGYQQQCVRYAPCMAYCCDKEVPGLSTIPNCQYFHCKGTIFKLVYWAQSCCSDSHIQQTGVAQNDLLVVVFTRMALLIEWDFQSFPKTIGEIVNCCRNNHAIKAHYNEGMKGEMFIIHFLKENVFWSLSVKLRHTLNLNCSSYLEVIIVEYWTFKHHF